MAGILIAYSSLEGQTAKIAEHISGLLAARGYRCHILDLEAGQAGETVFSDIEALVVAGSVHKGSHSKKMKGFLESNREALNRLKTLLVSVSLSAGSKDLADRDNAEEFARELLRQTGYLPTRMLLCAGAVKMDKYGLMTKLAVRIILQHKQIEVPEGGELELTDWDALEAGLSKFVDEVIEQEKPDHQTDVNA